MGGLEFSHKKGGLVVGKIGACFKKGLLLISIQTNLFQCYLSLSVLPVIVSFAFLHHVYQYSCVSWEDFNFIKSNWQICNLYKRVIFEKQRRRKTS